MKGKVTERETKRIFPSTTSFFKWSGQGQAKTEAEPSCTKHLECPPQHSPAISREQDQKQNRRDSGGGPALGTESTGPEECLCNMAVTGNAGRHWGCSAGVSGAHSGAAASS